MVSPLFARCRLMFGACEKSEEVEHTCNYYAGLFSVPFQSVAACAVVAYGLYPTDCHEARCKLALLPAESSLHHEPLK